MLKVEQGWQADSTVQFGVLDRVWYHIEHTNKDNDRVSDEFGHVKGYKNIYVQHGASISGSAGVNPYVFITALTNRNMTTILRRGFI